MEKNLEYKIEVDCGGRIETVSGSVPFAKGKNIVKVSLPEGKIVSAKAQMPFAVDSGEKVFMNGFQSWTSCPERSPNEKILKTEKLPKFIIEKFSLDRYSDYHFADYPEKIGILHGVSYGYVRKGAFYRLIASLDEHAGYTLIYADCSNGILRLIRDCAGVTCGGEYPVFELFYAEGSDSEVFDAWFAEMEIHPRTNRGIKGYTSWYNHYDEISEEEIGKDLEGCSKVLDEGDLFQIDDGWEPFVGDWLEPDRKKFPQGMRSASDKIHDKGLLSGLWISPFVCSEASALKKNHPDWLLLHDGQPWKDGCNWGGFYSLDIDNPQVEAYIRASFRKIFEDWNMDLVKIDFVYAAAPFGNENETRAARMYRALDLLRECCGAHPVIICGTPIMPAFGKFEYCRIGNDVGTDWDGNFVMRRLHRERVSTKNSIRNTYFRRQLNGRAWLNDPDVFFLREDHIELSWDQKIQLAESNARYGGVFLTSDNMGDYSKEALAEYRRLLTLRKSFDED